ncbi:helix-turn-helix domain-containing protein, partial [Leptospira perolatii]
PASYSFVFLFYAYGLRLIDKDFEGSFFLKGSIWCFCLVAILEFGALFLFGNSDDWQSVALGTWSDARKFKESNRFLAFISYGPRIFSVIAALLIFWKSFQLKEPNLISSKKLFGIRSLSILGALAAFISAWAQWEGNLKSTTHAIGALFVTLAVCGLYFASQWLPPFFDLNERGEKLSNTRLKGVNKEILILKLNQCMEADRSYRVEDLTLSMLANEITQKGFKISPEQLSEYINSEFKKNFNQFVNYYRVQEACELLLREKDRPILSIALSVGFNSKSTFNSVFKSSTRMSPVEFQAKHLKK